MDNPSLSHEVHKVDDAVSRLQKLHCAILSEAPPKPSSSSSGCLGRRQWHCQNIPELQQQSFEQLTGRSSSIKLGDLDHSSEAEYWRRWSSPGEFLQQTIADILVASEFAKDMAGLIATTLDNQAAEEPKVSQGGGVDKQKDPKLIRAERRKGGCGEGKENSDSSRHRVVRQAKKEEEVVGVWGGREGKENLNSARHRIVRQAKKEEEVGVRGGREGKENLNSTRHRIARQAKEGHALQSFSSGFMNIPQETLTSPPHHQLKARHRIVRQVTKGGRTLQAQTQIHPPPNPRLKARILVDKKPQQVLPSNPNESPCPKQRRKRHEASSRACRSAKVSALPLKTEPKFHLNITPITNTNRPWSLAQNKPLKSEAMFPNPALSPPKRTTSKIPKKPMSPQTPFLARRLSKKFSLHSSSRSFRTSNLPVSDSKAKLTSPRRSPKQSRLELQSRRVSLDPSKGFPNQPTSGFENDCQRSNSIQKTKNLLAQQVKPVAQVKDMPSSTVKEGGKSCKRPCKEGGCCCMPFKDDEDNTHCSKVTANMEVEDVEESECNPSGCSGSMWPVLKKRWSFSNENSGSKVDSSPHI